MKLKIAGDFAGILLTLTLHLTNSASAQQIGDRIYTSPASGDFFSMANTNWAPLPFMPFDPEEVPLYYLGVLNGFTGYAYDDRSIVYPGHGGNSGNSIDPPPDPGGGGGEGEDPGLPPPPPVDYGTNLFIMIGPTNTNHAWLSLSNTHSGTYYQILSRTPLNAVGWELGQIRQASGSLTPFDNIRTDDPTTTFFRGVGGDTVASIVLDPDYNLAVESATNGGAGSIGRFRVVLSPAPASTRTVVYKISGTASNGVDYTNLTGTVSVSTSGSADIVVQPNYGDLGTDQRLPRGSKTPNSYPADLRSQAPGDGRRHLGFRLDEALVDQQRLGLFYAAGSGQGSPAFRRNAVCCIFRS